MCDWPIWVRNIETSWREERTNWSGLLAVWYIQPGVTLNGNNRIVIIKEVREKTNKQTDKIEKVCLLGEFIVYNKCLYVYSGATSCNDRAYIGSLLTEV